MAARSSPEPRVCEIVLPVTVFELSDDDFLESEDEEQRAWEEPPFCLISGKAGIVKGGREAGGVGGGRLREGAPRVSYTETRAAPAKVMQKEAGDEEVPSTSEGLNAVSFQKAADYSEPDQNRVLGFSDLRKQNRTEKDDGRISDFGGDCSCDQRTLASLNTRNKGKSSVTDSVIKMAATGSQEMDRVAKPLVPELPSVDLGRSINSFHAVKEGTGPLEIGHDETGRNPRKSGQLNEEPCQSDRSEEYLDAADVNEQSAFPADFPEGSGEMTDGWQYLPCHCEGTSACLKKPICTGHKDKNHHELIQRSSFVSSERCPKFLEKRKAPKNRRAGRSDPGGNGWGEDEPAEEEKTTNKYKKFFYKLKSPEPLENFCCKVCSSLFSDPKDFWQHVKEHHLPPPYQCPQCEHASDDHLGFLNHLYWHAGHELYQCNFCAFLSRHSNSMVKHAYLHTGAKPYLCAVCRQGFTSASGLNRHAGTHCREHKSSTLEAAQEKEARPPQGRACEECDVVFYSETHLQSHQKCHVQENDCHAPSGDAQKHKSQRVVSEQADGSEEGKASSPGNSAGKKSDRVQSMYNCDRCNLPFRKEEHLVYHQAVHAMGENLTCNGQQSGGTAGSAEARPAGKPALKLFKCLQCAYMTSSFSNLRVHFTTHTGEKPFQCQECGKSFRSSSHLKRHGLLHVQKRHRCGRCPFIGSTADDLKAHRETCKGEGPAGKRLHLSALRGERSGEQAGTGEANGSTPSRESGARSYPCEHCAYSTRSLDNLKTHTRIHTSEKLYACEVCQKTFRTSSHLKRHAAVHQEVKFHCSSCDYSASTWPSYRQHLASHGEAHRLESQEEPPSPLNLHRCKKCSYSTLKKENLTVHYRIHTGERPYKCPQCGHAFRTSSHLKKHLPVHSKLHCDKCEFSTLDEQALEKHVKIHRKKKKNVRFAEPDEKVYKCNQCRLTFSALGLFKEHKKKHGDPSE